jgi:hypothetical protein
MWKCPKCGEQIEDQFEACWKCADPVAARQVNRGSSGHQFKIFEDQAGMSEAVKQGWSWPAFFFTVIWALVKKLYLTGLVVLAGSILLIVLRLDHLLANTAGWIIAVMFGVNGNRWRETQLLARGYTLRRTVTAGSTDEALANDGQDGAPGRRLTVPPPPGLVQAAIEWEPEEPVLDTTLNPEEQAFALFRAAAKLEAQGKVQDALATYQRVVDRFGGTTAAGDSQRSIDWLRARI